MHVIRTLRTAVVAALLLAAGNAWALGLGQIQVKSKRNQPLLAEIPIVSTTPGELAALQARLASPETFRRVGLAPPSGVAAVLIFTKHFRNCSSPTSSSNDGKFWLFFHFTI